MGGKYLVIYESQGGMAVLYNVAVLSALSEIDAKEKARSLFHTTAMTLRVYDLAELKDPWTFYY